jgi:uncharacterized membrane protein
LEFVGIGGGIAMMIGGLVIIGVLVYLAVTVSRNQNGRRHDGRSRAREILEERFARGEISASEFESMRNTL